MQGIPERFNGKKLLHAWEYRAADGAPLGIVARYQGTDGKEIIPFFRVNGSGFGMGAAPEPRPLFGLDCLAADADRRRVFIVEGEKCAAALQSLGLCAVTSQGGSKAAAKADWGPLSGYAEAFLLPDHDEPGQSYMRDVAAKLNALENPPALFVVGLPDLAAAGDVVDFLQNLCLTWNGLDPVPPDEKDDALQYFNEAVAYTAKPVPAEWGSVGSVSVDSGGFEWEIPGDLVSQLPPVQSLNPRLIPEPFRPWLADVAHRMQTPGDFSAVSALVIVSSIIGAGCSIRPKRYDDFEVVPNLWGACIGRPSVVLKSPSMKEPMGLLERLQAEYGERFEQEKAGAEFDGLTTKALLDDLKARLAKTTKARKSDAVDFNEVQKLKSDYVEISQKAESEPARRLFKTNETSIQSMTALQAQNPRGILTFRDELTGLLVKWDKEDGADERAYFLEGWNGNGSYTDMKIGRGLTDAKTICISLLGGIQPDKLKRYLYQALQGNNDGLMQRLQLAVWPDEPEQWKLIDTPPNRTDKARAYGILKTLAELDFIQSGAQQGEYDERPFFRFDDAAQAVFNQWLTDLQTVKIQHEDNPLMAEHLGKFRSLMPSLALVFHCIDIADGRARGAVSEQAAGLAVDWCAYLESHARRIYAMAESPEHETAVRLAGKIRAKGLQSPFTARDVERKNWHGLKDKPKIEAACNILTDESWLMMVRKPKPATGRPPLPEYYINPALL